MLKERLLAVVRVAVLLTEMGRLFVGKPSFDVCILRRLHCAENCSTLSLEVPQFRLKSVASDGFRSSVCY